MTTLIRDPSVERRIRAEREESGADRYDEVWQGVYVMGPMPNVEHQELVMKLASILQNAVPGASVYPGVNVSNCEEDWRQNYRVPDVALVKVDGGAKNCGTHLNGGPDFVIEIVSEDDQSRDKLPFYSEIGVGELLIVDRYPWVLELYRHDGSALSEVARSTIESPSSVVSKVLLLSFTLIPKGSRPMIEVCQAKSGQVWRA